MKPRSNPILILLALSAGVGLSSAAEKGSLFDMTIPPQARASLIPVRLMVPAGIKSRTDSQTAWQVVDGSRILQAQAADSSGISLCFLMPVEASESAVRKTLRLGGSPRAADPAFQFKEEGGKLLHLTEGNAPVLTLFCS